MMLVSSVILAMILHAANGWYVWPIRQESSMTASRAAFDIDPTPHSTTMPQAVIFTDFPLSRRPCRRMNEPIPQQSTASEAILEAARREKLRKIREMGIDPWGSRFDGHQRDRGNPRPGGGNHVASRSTKGTVPFLLRQKLGQSPTDHPPETHGPKVRAAGRIVLRRPSGKVHWLQIRDWTGTIQVMIGKSQVGDENFALAQCLDLGDIVGVDGEFKRTMKGELTIFAEDLKLLSKSIATPPEKHKGLADPELRQRRRYLDLIHTDGVLETFLRRSKIVQSIRNTLAGRGFVEVEGPTLQTIAGGAAARPFITHHNALDIDLYLRIALELHLKRLLVGGIERVYEMGRVYRNEGIDARHNPEFTMIEIYQAYGNYETMMELTEAMITDAIRATGPAVRAAVGREDDRLYAAVRAKDLRRAIRRAHRPCSPTTPRALRSWPNRSASMPPASTPTW